MTVYRLIEVNGEVAPAEGLVDQVVKAVDVEDPKLIVLEGVAGSGKTLTAQAVKEKLLRDKMLNTDNLHELSSINNQEAQSIEYANNNIVLNDNIDDEQPINLVIWDEVRYSEAETWAIARLCNLGYNVIALTQESGLYEKMSHLAFKNLAVFKLA